MVSLIVKNPCKTIFKTQCNLCENFCAKLINIIKMCINSTFSHRFSPLSHPLFHNLLIDRSYLYFPLFHRPYNYYNNNYLIINSNN